MPKLWKGAVRSVRYELIKSHFAHLKSKTLDLIMKQYKIKYNWEVEKNL